MQRHGRARSGREQHSLADSLEAANRRRSTIGGQRDVRVLRAADPTRAFTERKTTNQREPTIRRRQSLQSPAAPRLDRPLMLLLLVEKRLPLTTHGHRSLADLYR